MNVVEMVKKLGLKSVTVVLAFMMLLMSVFLLVKEEYGTAVCTLLLCAGNVFLAYRDIKKLT
jgi:hypothetical protein